MWVYKTTNLINGKSYVGQDSKEDLRYFGSGFLIKRAVRKYGKENFSKEVVAWCDTLDKLNFLEQFYVNFFKTRNPDGYNLTDGGGGLLHPSEETKQLLRESVRLSWKDPEIRKKKTDAQNRIEVKNKRSESMKLVFSNPKVKEKLSSAARKHWAYPENREEQSRKLKIVFSLKYPKPELPELKLCECGCGKYAKPGKKFIVGHNHKGKPKTGGRVKKIY